MKCDAKCIVISGSTEIQASFYTEQTYRTAVSYNQTHNLLKFVSKPPQTDKSRQSCTKIALSRENVKIALHKITIFWQF